MGFEPKVPPEQPSITRQHKAEIPKSINKLARLAMWVTRIDLTIKRRWHWSL